jgi:hypothetical protein
MRAFQAQLPGLVQLAVWIPGQHPGNNRRCKHTRGKTSHQMLRHKTPLNSACLPQCYGVQSNAPFWRSPVEQYRGTTILSVRRNDSVVIGGDGQVSMGDTVMKGNARKGK